MAKPIRKKRTPTGTPPFEPVGVALKRLYQQIKADSQFEDLQLSPKYIPNLYVSNEIIRAFARLIAQGPTGPTVLRATKDGALAVVQRGGAFDAYYRLDHTFAAADEEYEFTFTGQVERIDIFTYNGKVDYQLTRDAVQAYGSAIPLFEDSFYSLDFYTLKAKATCKTFAAATPTRSTLFGWYRLEG